MLQLEAIEIEKFESKSEKRRGSEWMLQGEERAEQNEGGATVFLSRYLPLKACANGFQNPTLQTISHSHKLSNATQKRLHMHPNQRQ